MLNWIRHVMSLAGSAATAVPAMLATCSSQPREFAQAQVPEARTIEQHSILACAAGPLSVEALRLVQPWGVGSSAAFCVYVVRMFDAFKDPHFDVQHVRQSPCYRQRQSGLHATCMYTCFR